MTNDNKQPNLFLVGAPKCGTTSLASWLGGHPACFVPKMKEPHYFGDFGVIDRECYATLYLSAEARHSVRIDASTGYLTSAGAISEILIYNPKAKFIVMLRNPIDLVYALYGERLFLSQETASSFEDAWRLQGRRKEGKNIPAFCADPRRLFYKDQAMLGASLTELLRQAGRDKVYWTFTEDLSANPRHIYLEILNFLGLADDGRMEFPVYNKSKINRYPRLSRIVMEAARLREKIGLPRFNIYSRLLRNAKRDFTRPPLSLEMKQELYREFRSDIETLAHITGQDLSHWRPC
jgi:hypothetical protein